MEEEGREEGGGRMTRWRNVTEEVEEEDEEEDEAVDDEGVEECLRGGRGGGIRQ